jgi:hypothetical protein
MRLTEQSETFGEKHTVPLVNNSSVVQGVKCQGRESHHSPPSIAEVKNERRYASTQSLS